MCAVLQPLAVSVFSCSNIQCLTCTKCEQIKEKNLFPADWQNRTCTQEPNPNQIRARNCPHHVLKLKYELTEGGLPRRWRPTTLHERCAT